jgi:hypothetical protein
MFRAWRVVTCVIPWLCWSVLTVTSSALLALLTMPDLGKQFHKEQIESDRIRKVENNIAAAAKQLLPLTNVVELQFAGVGKFLNYSKPLLRIRDVLSRIREFSYPGSRIPDLTSQVKGEELKENDLFLAAYSFKTKF